MNIKKKDTVSSNGCLASNSQQESCDSSVTLSQRTTALVRGIDLVLQHHDVDLVIRQAMDHQIHAYLDTSPDELVWLKRCKYLLTFPLAKYLKNEPPPSPDIAFEPVGKFRQWMKYYLMCYNRKNTHLWFSWLQCKRATLPLSETFIIKTYDDHFKALSREDPGDEDTIDAIFDEPSFQKVLETVSRQVESHCERDFTEYTPSGSACFERTRLQGGQFGQLEHISFDSQSDPVSTPSWRLPCTDLVRMDYLPVVYSRFGEDYGVVSEVREPYGRDEWTLTLNEVRKVLWTDVSKFPDCTIQGILEPNKVRVISKGEALPYYVCKPIQKAMHTSLRKWPCFRLIGQPFSADMMVDLQEKAQPSDLWFSIDYSAATDGLSWLYSGRILEKILSRLPLERQLECLKVLGPHRLHYPDPSDPKNPPIYKGDQQNGQLMGSILSFPILCLANLGVYLYVTRHAQKDWSLAERLNHVLVNGDDMVYAADRSLWKEHVLVAGKVGLEMSVGKAYIHHSYANVNSTSVHADILRKETPVVIPFLNVGLYFGIHKVQQSSFTNAQRRLNDESLPPESKWSSLGVDPSVLNRLLKPIYLDVDVIDEGLITIIPEILKGCFEKYKGRVLASYLSLHGEKIRSEQLGVLSSRGKLSLFSRNLFLPISLGGFGIQKPVGFRSKIKPLQKRVAYSLILLGGHRKASQLPLPGWSLRTHDPVCPPWTRKVVVPEVFQLRTLECHKELKKIDLYSFQNLSYGSNPSTWSC